MDVVTVQFLFAFPKVNNIEVVNEKHPKSTKGEKLIKLE